ncbi:MAG TPA: hypothetical protein VD927_15305 [Chryseosolibacter sp.]|nr:hypothetical protein [Chryseosolibacter sp.]
MLNVFKALNPQDQLIISHRFLKFAEERKKVKCSFLILNNLAKAATAPEAPETLDCINTWIAFIDSNPELPENFIAGKPVNDVAVLSKGRFFDTSRASGCPFD